MRIMVPRTDLSESHEEEEREKVVIMASNAPKKNRPDQSAAEQKLIDGFNKHVQTITSFVIEDNPDKPPTQVIPKFEMPYQPPILDGRIANAEAVIRSQIHPGARRCYQKGLESNPTRRAASSS
jgi:hypothetical protein